MYVSRNLGRTVLIQSGCQYIPACTYGSGDPNFFNVNNLRE